MKKAFTIAEVLITLGIIGIVAAMTLPVVIGNYQKKVIVEKLKTVYSKLAEIIKYSEMYNGEVNSWDYTLSNEEFIKIYFAPYIENFKLNDSVWSFYSLDGEWGSGVGSGGYSKFSLSNGTLVAINTSKGNNVQV